MMKGLVSFLSKNALADRLLHGAFWSVFGAFFSSGINLFGMLLIARLLGKSDYGEVVAVQSTLGAAGVLAGFGIGSTATRYTATLRSANPAKMLDIIGLCQSTVIVFGVGTAASLVLFSSYIAGALFSAPQLAPLIDLAALSVLFTALDSFQKCVLMGLEAMKRIAKGTLIANLLGVTALVVLADLFGVRGAVAGVVFNAFVQFVVSRRQLSAELRDVGRLRFGIKFPVEERHVLWRYSFPALLSAVMVTPAHWIAQGVLARGERGLAEVAVLGIAMQWFNLILFIPNTAGRVVLPVLSERIAADGAGDSRKILKWAALANGVVALPVAIFGVIFSGHILDLYGSQYRGYDLAIVFSVLTASVLAVISPVGNLIAASGQMWTGVAMNALWSAVYMSGVFLMAGYGATGVMAALCFAYCLHGLWTALFAAYFFKKN